MQPTPLESRVLESIDEQRLVDSLVSMIHRPSVTGTSAESDLQHEHATALETAGMNVDAWKFDLDELRSHPDYPGEEAPRTEGFGLVGVSGDGHPALVLQGHIDVVPTGDLENWPEGDPFSGHITGSGRGVLHGRGACDMKAGVAVNLAVVRAIAASGIRLERPIAVHSVISEEDGGLGAFGTLLRGHRGEAAVLTEPTSGRIVTACAGALTFELRVRGRAAHGSTRLEGVSAFDAFIPITIAIRELERERNLDPDPLFSGYSMPYPISIGRIRAGDWASSVPDLLTAEGRLGVKLGEEVGSARAEFERMIADTCASDPWLRDHPVSVSWPGGQFASGAIDADHSLVGEVADAIATVSGQRPLLQGAPYGSDLRLYAGLGGIPSLHFGPGDVRFAHAPREQVNLDEVVEVARALTLLAVRRCGGHL